MGNVLDCAADPLSRIDGGEGGGAPEAAPAASGAAVLEREALLSESRLWELQRAYYDDKGVDCWAKGLVPNFVSTNSFIARAYAQAFVALLGDIFDAPGADRSEPVYVVEVGAGPGKFAHLFLTHVLEMREFLPAVQGRDLPFVYVLSDASAAMADFWAGHAKLSEFGDALDFAVFDAETVAPGEVTLARSGAVLAGLKHPVVAVANYVVDSVRADAFRVTAAGELERARVTLVAAAGEPPADAAPGATLAGLKCAWTYSPAPPDGGPLYPGEPELDAVARSFQAHPSSSIVFPVGGLRLLGRLAALSAGGRLVALVGDKGFLRAEEMAGDRDPHLAFHGSFSAMVNFAALQTFAEARGGFMEATPYAEGFKTALLTLNLARGAVAQAAWAWRDAVRPLGPDGFAVLQRCSRDDAPQPSLKHLLALFRVAGGDADVFFKAKRQLLAHVVNSSLAATQRHDLLGDVAAISAAYFPMQKSRDVCFELGRVLMALKEYPRAVEMFGESMQHCGPHHVTWQNMGICHYHQDAIADALRCFDAALAMQPGHQEAAHWKTKAELRMGMGMVRAEDHPASSS